MFPARVLLLAVLLIFLDGVLLVAADLPHTQAGNRLTYLDSDDPFYPHKDFPKLITPQWVGEDGVEAVVILAIDDMRETKKYETFLRPILERLKKIDGRAPVSIFANVVQPDDPQLQAWLKEGLSLEVHTLAHPCPLLQKGSFTNAASTVHGCVDLLNQVPGNKPVAFRMPCCDSMNSPSPRFYAEIFNRTSPAGNFLTIDSSVMNITTPKDTSLPRELVLDADGKERFRKYLTAETNATRKVSMKSFVTTIEDYPYPYVINKLCWEFPCALPSDWEAFNYHGATNPITLADWKASLDVTVIKQGVMTWIFHPHGWSSPAQIVEFIDYAVSKHGKKVKFLTFKEAQERLNKNLLRGNSLRIGNYDNGVRLLDVNNDGFMDVLIGHTYGSVATLDKDGNVGRRKNGTDVQLTRIWDPKDSKWVETALPFSFVRHDSAFSISSLIFGPGSGWVETGVKFGILRANGNATAFFNNGDEERGAWHFDGMTWQKDETFWNGLPDTNTAPYSFEMAITGKNVRLYSPVEISQTSLSLNGDSRDSGVLLRDMDHDGRCELIIANAIQITNSRKQAIFSWDEAARTWKKLPDAAWPKGVAIVNERGEDNGVRFADINGDGYEDLIYSNEKEFGVWLYIATAKPNLGWEKGWSYKQRGGKRAGAPSISSASSAPQAEQMLGAPNEIPPFVRSGPQRNNGAWFHSGHLWIQNEDTASLPDKVDRRSFKELLVGDEPPPMSPEQSLAAMKIRPGFKAELVAGEPLVMDPVAFDWGPDGRLWVVEMADYPRGIDDKGKPGGRVIFLEDTDGDGRYDKRTVFLDGVNFPNGIMCWRKGVLVSAAPDIFYAEDTDGDGKADVKKVLFTGFREGNQQHRINGFEYGLDNWVYAANGDSGGQIVRVGGVLTGPLATNSPPIDIRGYDIRFKPDTGEIDLVAGQTQFGRHRDDWGNWFGNNNPNWLWHYHIPIHYLKRNPYLAVKSTRTMLANYSPPNEVFTVGKAQQRFNWADRTNQVTSANSATPYRDELFGPDFATSVFMSEPANNVVHREVLEPDGVTFKSHRAPDEQNIEFIASADKWFRPTMLKTGPDGALYIADMYRLIIEHPEYFPEELKNRPDMRDGDDKGRIWRVHPINATLRKIPRLDKLNTTELVAAMDSPNGWQRDVAQRLLLEKQDRAAAGPLRQLFDKSSNPKVRLQALCTYSGLLKTTGTIMLVKAMKDPHPAVRQWAIWAAERDSPNDFLVALTIMGAGKDDPDSGPLPPWGSPVNDPDIRVRYQLALSLGELRETGYFTSGLLQQLALRDFGNPHMQVAIMSSAVPHIEKLLAAGFPANQGRAPSPQFAESLIGLATALRLDNNLGVKNPANSPMQEGNRQDGILGGALRNISRNATGKFAPWQFFALAGFLDALDRRNTPLAKYQSSAGSWSAQAIDQFPGLFAQARQTALDPQAGEGDRLTAIRLLGRGLTEQDEDYGRLGALLAPQVPSEIQQAALTGLKRATGPRVGEILLTGWKSYGPAVRAEVLNTLFTRTEWLQVLLAAIEDGRLSAGEIGAAQKQKLLAHSQSAIRERAAKLFAAVGSDRLKVVKQYESVAELKGDTGRGAALFRQNCATCHRLNGEGSNVGPDLGSMADKSVASLLVAVLDPNQAVDAAYAAYTIQTKNDRELAGIIAAETPNSITLRMPGGTEETVLRTEIKQMSGSRLSLMPEGFEKALTPQAMADLIAWLQTGAAKP